MVAILQVLSETPVIMHGKKCVEAECLTLSNKRKEKKTLCVPKEEWQGVKETLQIS